MKKKTYVSRASIVILLLLTYSLTFAFTVDGTIYDVETNEGIENATVFLILGNLWRVDYSDENGNYNFFDIEEDYYSFKVIATGYIEHNTAFTVSEDMIYDVYMEVQPDNGFLNGTVTLNGGIGNMQSVLITAGSETTNPDVDGNYSIEIQPGTYDVTATLEYYSRDTVTDVVVEEAIATEGVDLILVYFDPPENLTIDDEIAFLSWDAPASGNPIGYDIYLDSVFLENIINTEFQFEYLDIGQAYMAGVSAVYDVGTSEIIEIDFTYTPTFNPPTNLVVDEATGLFTWDAPTRDLSGYNVYLDGEANFIGYATTPEWQFNTAMLTPGIHQAGLIAAYDNPAGASDYVSIDFEWNPQNAGDNLILATELSGNYPNPFNPTTTISFSVTTESTEITELIIYNQKGQKVKQLISDQLSAGKHSVVWNGDDENNKPVSSGMYLYKLKNGTYSSTKKMILMK